MPTSAHGMFFAATRLAIAKMAGGIWPIAVGYKWQLLIAKVACNYIKVASAALLEQIKLGFSITTYKRSRDCPGCYIVNMQQGQLFLKIDFGNAFNTLCWDSVLDVVAR
jgi:hypothetical protein